MATTARYREGTGERLGRVPERLRAAVRGRRVVWVHAVSVGEVLAVSRLVAELEGALQQGGAVADGAVPDAAVPDAAVPDGAVHKVAHDGAAGPAGGRSGESGDSSEPWLIVISTTTRTGQALARERFGAERVFYLPLDFAWAVRAYLRVLRPAVVILAESEIWPRLLWECRRSGVPVAVANARVSDRSLRRGLRWRRVWGRVLGGVALFLAQSEEDARRLRALGVRPEAVRVSGNLKYDLRAAGGNAMAEMLREALGGRPVIVAGSTVEGEEELVMRAFREVWAAVPEAFLVMAPRHPERFRAALEAGEDFGAVRASSLTAENAGRVLRQVAVEEENGRTPTSRCLAVVLDTVGDLAAVYGIAAVAFVGGSLVRRGGHNPLEPARWGVPVVMGSSFENFREVVGAMERAEAIALVKNEEELGATLIRLLTNSGAANTLGERARNVFQEEGGATARSIQFLMPLLRTYDRASQSDASVALTRHGGRP